MYHLLLAIVIVMCVCAADTLPAQTEALTQAVQAITGADVARHVRAIADDSMLGRDTPSRGLELTARYVAEQFEQLGLKPDGDGGTWFQRYPVPLDFSRSRVIFAADGKRVVAGFATAARFVRRPVLRQSVPIQPQQAGVVLVTGLYPRSGSVERSFESKMSGKIALYVPPADADSAVQDESVRRIHSGAAGVVILREEDSATFARNLQAFTDDLMRIERLPSTKASAPWSVSVRLGAVEDLTTLLVAAGVDLAQSRAERRFNVRELPSLNVSIELLRQGVLDDTATAPNVVGLLPGSDSTLKHEYVLVSAHMDHLGITSGHPDSIQNGTDDNASGVAGLIELAQAFSQPGARPRRSLIFLAVSGGAKGFWGSDFAAQRIADWRRIIRLSVNSVNAPFIRPIDPIKEKLNGFWNVIANLNLDMIGGGTGGSLTIKGLADMELAAPLDWMVARHPELQLATTDGGTAVKPESDHFPFIRRLGIPGLYFHTGTHRGAPPTTDTTAAVNGEQAAHILRFVFYLGREIANAEQRPKWTTVGRRRFVEATVAR